MAEEKKPEADKNAPKKAAAPRRTKAKTSSKPEVKAQTAVAGMSILDALLARIFLDIFVLNFLALSLM